MVTTVVNNVTNSIEFRFLVDRALLARSNGQHNLASTFAIAAEGLLRSALPNISTEIGLICSRKGDGQALAARVITAVAPSEAACVVCVWTLRSSRRAAIDYVSAAFKSVPAFNETIRMLFSRIIPTSTSATPIGSVPPPIETAAPACRR